MRLVCLFDNHQQAFYNGFVENLIRQCAQGRNSKEVKAFRSDAGQ